MAVVAKQRPIEPGQLAVGDALLDLVGLLLCQVTALHRCIDLVVGCALHGVLQLRGIDAQLLRDSVEEARTSALVGLLRHHQRAGTERDRERDGRGSSDPPLSRHRRASFMATTPPLRS